MTTQNVSTVSPVPLTSAERRELRPLRLHYPRDRDLFSPQEVARLQFLYWLYHTGRLAP